MKTLIFPALLTLLATVTPVVCQDQETGEEKPPDLPKIETKWRDDTAAELFAQARDAAAEEPERALALYGRGLQKEPANVAARDSYATLLLARKRPDLALAEYRILWHDDPTPARATVLVRALLAAGQPTDAAVAAEDAAKAFPDDPEMALLAGEALVAAGAPDRALPYLETPAATPAGRLALATAAEKTGDDFLAARTWAGLLGSEHDDAAREALGRLRDRATTVGRLTLFTPADWRPTPDGWTNADATLVVTVAGPPEEAPAVAARALVVKGLPAEAVALIEGQQSGPGAEALRDHATKEHGDRADEVVAKSAALGEHPASLTVAELPDPPGHVTRLDATAEAVFLPVAPLTRCAWVGTVADQPLAVTLTAPAGLTADAFHELLRTIAARALVLPEVKP